MKVKILLVTLFTSLLFNYSIVNAQTYEQARVDKKGNLLINYYENEPFSYKEKGDYVGIEMEILNSFVSWMKTEKGIELDIEYVKYEEFKNFYERTQTGLYNTVGLGSVSILEERKNVIFSAPYLRNVSVLVSDGSVPTARTKAELSNDVLSLRPVTIKGSLHQTYLTDLYKANNGEAIFQYVTEVEGIPLKIKESSKYFGYMDIISFWKYVKKSDHYIKLHPAATKNDEYFGFIFPLGSDWNRAFNEFFESGFGFTATREYHEILKKYLGFEIIEKVELR